MAFCRRQAERSEQGKSRRFAKPESERLARAKEWQAKKAEAGYAAGQYTTEYGGLGGTPIQSVIYSQEESNFDVPGGFFEIGLGMCIPTMMKWATKEQCDRYVPALYGEEIWCHARTGSRFRCRGSAHKMRERRR